MNKFIQIRGSMGSGKSSTVRQWLQRQDDFKLHQIKVRGRHYPYYYSEKKRTVVTGSYGNRTTDGLDGIITNKEVMRDYLLGIIDALKPRLMIFEAVMYGLTTKFCLSLCEELEARGYKYCGIALIPPFEVTFNNIMLRNGGKKIDKKALLSKYNQAKTSANKLLELGVDIKIVDTSQIPLTQLWRLIDKEIANE